MEVLRNCLICGEYPVSLSSRYAQSFLTKCKKCNLVFASIIPSQDGLDQHYSQYPRNVEVSRLTKSVYDKWINV